MQSEDDGTAGGQPVWLLAVLVAVVVLPVLLTPYPPLQDWANHLARLHILANPDDPVLSQFYRPDWALRPNLCFDLIGLALAQVLPSETAGRVFLVLAVTVFATAPMVLERALRGAVLGASLLALPVVFNLALQKGFLGYYLSAGMAVWAYAFWIGAAGPWRRGAVAWISAFVLFVCHLYALGIFAILVGGHWLGERLAGRSSGRDWLIAGVVSGSAFFVPAAIFLSTPTAGAASVTRWVSLDLKLLGLISAPMLVPTALNVAILAVAALPLALRLARRKPVFGAAQGLPILIMCVLLLALPYWLMSSANADWRIMPPLALVVAGSADLGLRDPGMRRTIAILAAVLAVAASVSAWQFWARSQPMILSIERASAGIEPGARLFPVILDPVPWTADRSVPQNEPAHAVRRGVFVPSVFAIPSQQPLRFTEAVESLRRPFGKVFYGEVPPDWSGVAANFDCVLLLHTDAGSMGTTPDLPIDATPVVAEPGAVLYRVGATTVCGD